MKQLRTVGQGHQAGMCLLAHRAVGTPTPIATSMPTATVVWRSFATGSLSERAFGKRLHGYDIPATGACRPKEPST